MSSCVHDGRIVFEAEGKRLRAANQRGITAALRWADWFIDLAGLRYGIQFDRPPLVVRALELEPAVGSVTEPGRMRLVAIEWEDYSPPPEECELSFWRKLWNVIAGDIVIACVGGHGRTGTALASLLIAGVGLSAPEAIAAVRARHCAEAIETVGQEKYLYRLAASER